ncbi:MAG: hypothetical protein WD669_05680 [Pirellulales bacterium]
MDAPAFYPSEAEAPSRCGTNDRRVIWSYYLALAFYASVVIVSLRNYVPIWDGWAFYHDCFMNAANTGDCSCLGHVAFLPTALYGAVAYVFPYNFTAFAFVNLTMGLVACYALGRSLSHLFPSRPWLSHVASSLLLLNPVMFAQVIQPSLDYPLAVLTALVVAAFLAGDLLIATLIGLLMTSTKEPGIMIYGVFLIAFMLVTLWERARTRDFKDAARYAVKHSYTILPLLGFVLYSIFLGLHGGSFGKQSLSLEDVAEKLLVLFPDPDLLLAQMASLFVLNFSWLLTAAFVASIAALIIRPGWLSPPARQWLVVVSASLAAGCYLHTRVLLWNNPRYVLPLFVFLLTGFVVAVSQLHARFPRLAAAAVIACLPLFIASQFFTIDPLSKRTFRTFDFGQHEMLSMGGFRRLPLNWRHAYYGRDQQVYNLQFVKFSELAEQAVREFGLDAHYVTGPVFTGWTDFQNYDEHSLRRSMRPDARKIDFFPIEQASDDYRNGKRQGGFVFLAFPNVINDDTLHVLRKRYESLSERTVSCGGYSIQAYEFGSPKSSEARSDEAGKSGSPIDP